MLINASLIAVTGLGGHAYGSWTSRNTGAMWLRDFLPPVIPSARILTYGYNSQWLNATSAQDLLDFGRDLLDQLSLVRSLPQVIGTKSCYYESLT